MSFIILRLTEEGHIIDLTRDAHKAAKTSFHGHSISVAGAAAPAAPAAPPQDLSNRDRELDIFYEVFGQRQGLPDTGKLHEEMI